MKRIVYAFVAVASLLLAGIVGVTHWYLSRFDLESIRVPIEEQLTKLLDREVTLGRVRRGAGWLRPHIEADEIDVLADAASGSRLAHIDQAEMGLDLLPLLLGTLRIDSLDLRGVRLDLGTDAAGRPLWPLHLAGRASGAARGLRVEIEDIQLRQGELWYYDGERGATTHASIDEFALDTQASGHVDLSLRGEIESLPMRMQGELAPPSNAGADASRRIELEGGLGEVSLRASGTVANAFELAGLDLALEASAPRLPLPDDWGESFSLEHPVASARLVDPRGIARLEDVRLEAGGGPQRLQLTGRVEDVFGARRAVFEATLELPDLRALSPLVQIDLPDLGPVRGTMKLREAGEKLDMEGIDMAVGDNGARAQMQGTIRDLTGLVDLDLRVQVEAPMLRDLVPDLDPRLQELGPLRAEAHAEGAGSAVRLREIDAQLGRRDDLWASAQGEVDVVAGANQVRLALRGGAPSTGRLAALLERELPELGPVTARAALRGSLEQLRLDQGELRAGRSPQSLLVLKSASLPLPPGSSFDVEAELSARDLLALGRPFDRELPRRGPVQASGTLSVTPGRVALHRLQARVARTRLSGSGASRVDARGRRHLTLELSSPELHLDDLTPEPGPGEENGSFLQQRLPVDLLRAQDAELLLHFDRVLGRRDLDLEDLETRLRLEGGRLRLDPFSFQWRSGAQLGPVDAHGGVDASGSEPSWWLRVEARRIDLATVTEQFTAEEPVTGLGLISADLTSHGQSGQEVMEGLDGDFTLAVRDGTLQGDYVVLLRRDLIAELALQWVRREATKARCILAPFRLADGVASTDRFLLDTGGVLFYARGSIDLPRERLDLVLTPKAKRPGIGLMQPLALGGSFQKPTVRPVKLALAKDAAKALLGTLVVPGLGTLAPFLQLGTFGKDPCQEALTSYLASKQ